MVHYQQGPFIYCYFKKCNLFVNNLALNTEYVRFIIRHINI
jgi:hypothetical protein